MANEDKTLKEEFPKWPSLSDRINAANRADPDPVLRDFYQRDSMEKSVQVASEVIATLRSPGWDHIERMLATLASNTQIRLREDDITNATNLTGLVCFRSGRVDAVDHIMNTLASTVRDAGRLSKELTARKQQTQEEEK